MRKEITSFVMIFLILTSVLAVSGVAAQPSEKVAVIVGFKGKPETGLIRAHSGDIKYEYSIISAVACSLPQGAIDALNRNPKIAYIEPDGQVQITQTLPWGVDRIDAEVVHTYNKGTGVKVAIIDTGIDYNHPDLDDNYKEGYDFVNDDNDPMDDNGHGTHCAGIVAAEDNEEGVIGVAPEAGLYAIKVLDRTGSGYTSDVISGIQWAITNKMDVISMSLGSDYYNSALQAACDAAYDAGVLVVAAAGNDYQRRGRTEVDTVDYPARYDSVIAVGATDVTDTKASWSSTGSALELAAPGVSIYSTYLDSTYDTYSGTSMACPHVAGTAALVFASSIDPAYDSDEDGLWDADEVRERLQDTADDLGSAEWDHWYGYGLVDADEAAPGVDTTPPVISAVASSDVTTSSATITWTTDEPSDSVVNYGTPTALGSTVSDVTMVTSHSVTVTGLAAETIYYYEVASTDSAGNSVVDNNGGAYYTFTTLTPDTEPPSKITDLTATAGAYPDIHLEWPVAADNVGVDHHNIYRSTTEPIDKETDFLATAAGTATSYTDSTGTAETTYNYAVCAVDAAGNEAALSNIASAMVAAAPSNTMHVASIDMSTDSRIAGRNTFVWAIATVTVVDAKDIPVGGATVYGHWEVATTDSDSGITDASGQVSLQSDSVKNPPSGTEFVFLVDDIVLSGWTYDPDAS